MIRIRRAYDRPSPGEGALFLVDRLWPRGVSKGALKGVTWCREAAPGHALRRWVHQNPGQWEVFQRRYREELDAHPEAWQPILAAARRGPVTLLYSARDTARNNAHVLRDYLEERLEERLREQTREPRRRSQVKRRS